MKLSIVVPVYNGEKTINKTLDSICEQQFPDYEVVIVNDGSTDKTLEIIECFIKKHPEVTIKVISKQNEGLPYARKTGIEHSCGEYVGFVDADDWVDKEMYSRLISACEEKDADVGCCNIVFDYQNRKRVMKQNLETGKTLNSEEAMHALNCRIGVFSSYCNKIIRRNLFQGIKYPKVNMSNEDYVVMIQILPKAERVVPVCYDGYHYVQYSGSMIRGGFGKADEYGYYCLKRILFDVYKNGSPKEKKEFDTYMVDFFLFLVVDMGINKNYDKKMIEWIRKYLKKRIFDIVFSKYHTLLCKGSVISVCVNYRLFLMIYGAYRRFIERWA